MPEYPILTPTLLALKDVRSDPQGTEDAAKCDDVHRQTRTWLYDFLSKYIDETTDKLKSGGFGSDSLPTGSVRGSTDNGGTQREILQGTVSDVDIRDNAVTSTKIKTKAVL